MSVIEYYYSAHSAYAYIGSARLAQICAAHDVTLIHKPILLTPVVEAQGSLPFRARTQAHVNYFFGREIERWAEHRDVEIVSFRPAYHDADYSLASGIIIALGESGAPTDQMAHRLLEVHWRDDADLSNRDTLTAVATELGHDPIVLLAEAASDRVQEGLRDNSAAAEAGAIFGSPTYVVDGDPFYGQDRLELVECALTKPFAPTSFRNPPVSPRG